MASDLQEGAFCSFAVGMLSPTSDVAQVLLKHAGNHEGEVGGWSTVLCTSGSLSSL